MSIFRLSPIREDLLLHTGSSDQEKASEKQYAQVSGFNPNVRNRYNAPLPFSPTGILNTFNAAGKAGVKNIKQQTAENVNKAQKSTTAGLQSRGAGGSILEDAIAKSRSEASGQGTNAIRSFLTSRLGMLPGVMEGANRQELLRLSGATGTDFGNVNNMFQKFSQQQGAIGGLSDDTTLDDFLAVANTASQFIPKP